MQRLDLRVSATRARSVPIHVGPGALHTLVRDLAFLSPGGRVAVVSDSNVGPRYGEPLCEEMRAEGLAAFLITFPAGEASKTRETKSRLEESLFEQGADRQTTVVALGGGVTGDLAGFVAATWHRGVPFVQAPTSLLAMVDAAVGGKTAVNLPGGKNLVGSFHQPVGVYADLSALATLGPEDLAAGFGEAVKTAVVADGALFQRLEADVPSLVRGEPDALLGVIVSCIRVKARIVARDERESGRRAILNFGHTVAHALEATSGSRLAHGPAVSVGMVVESRLAARLTGFPVRHVRRLRSLLDRFGLPTTAPAGLSTDEVLRAIERDKKVRDGALRFSLPARIGRMPSGKDVTHAVEADLVRAVVEEAKTSTAR